MAYVHYYRTGIQDCHNAFSHDDFSEAIRKRRDLSRDEHDLAVEIVSEVLASWESERESWIADNTEDARAEGLDPEVCYQEWFRGWSQTARIYVARAIVRAREEREIP